MIFSGSQERRAQYEMIFQAFDGQRLGTVLDCGKHRETEAETNQTASRCNDQGIDGRFCRIRVQILCVDSESIPKYEVLHK